MARLRSLRPNRPVSKREKALAITFFLLLAASLYYFLVFEKQMQKIKSLKEQVAQRDALVREMYRKNYHNISDMENKIREYDGMIAKVYELVPNIKDTPGFLVDFHRLLTENRLTSDNISFGQLKSQKNYSTFTLSLKAKGAAADVRNFLKSIEKYKRAVTINKLDFKPTEEGLLETNVDLTVYVMHDIAEDPLEYSFMGDEFGEIDAFEMFKYPEPKGEGTGVQPGIPVDIMNFFNGLKPRGKDAQVPALPTDLGLPGGRTGTKPSGSAPQGQSPTGGGKSQGQAPGGSSAPGQEPKQDKTIVPLTGQPVNPAIGTSAGLPVPTSAINPAIRKPDQNRTKT